MATVRTGTWEVQVPAVTGNLQANAEVVQMYEAATKLKKLKYSGGNVSDDVLGQAIKDLVKVASASTGYTQADRDLAAADRVQASARHHNVRAMNENRGNTSAPSILSRLQREVAPVVGANPPSPPVGTLPAFLGDGAANGIFPQTTGALDGLNGAQMDNLETFYGVAFQGQSAAVRIRKFKTYIGL